MAQQLHNVLDTGTDMPNYSYDDGDGDPNPKATLYKIWRVHGNINSTQGDALYYEDLSKLKADLMKFALEEASYNQYNSSKMWLKTYFRKPKLGDETTTTKRLEVYELIDSRWIKIHYELVPPRLELLDTSIDN